MLLRFLICAAIAGAAQWVLFLLRDELILLPRIVAVVFGTYLYVVAMGGPIFWAISTLLGASFLFGGWELRRNGVSVLQTLTIVVFAFVCLVIAFFVIAGII